ncbi:hypothetical protein RDI58_019767 [Solanum bulbocastanum]|uniref:Uncharacterized protein n=1 Tax=Solanum bulbocastanum TaxID=147425 RepID=A0AAN8TDX5_SOLBU
MGETIAENQTSHSHPTLKSNEIEKKDINFSSVKIEVEEEEQKEKDLGYSYSDGDKWSPLKVSLTLAYHHVLLQLMVTDFVWCASSESLLTFQYFMGGFLSGRRILSANGDVYPSLVIYLFPSEVYFNFVYREHLTFDMCKTQGPFQKQLLVDHSPAITALHLMRFKNNGLVVQKEEIKYDHYTVIVHYGPSISSRH